MDQQHSYEELITAGIKGLPQELLAEIVDFVYVVRKRFIQPQAFASELETMLLTTPANGDPTPNGGWQSLAGSISLDDLQLMHEAIEAGCEQVDSDEW